MNFIENVGNIKLYYRENDIRPRDMAISLFALNGSDIVAAETFKQVYTNHDLRIAVEIFLYHNFKIYTIDSIRAGIPKITSEYDGRLLSGTIAGFTGTEYFKRIDNTRYYKHYNHKPIM